MATAQPPKPPDEHPEQHEPLRELLDRKQLQIDVSTAVVSKLTLKDLLLAISALLKQFIDHDVASVVLYDERRSQLRVHALDNPTSGGVLTEGSLLPLEGTPPGLAITTRQTIRREQIDLEEFHSPIMRQAHAAGLRSGCSVPLISHERILGTINVGSLREAAFSEAHQELLEQISSQVAIAVENALNFERAERERKRSQLLLEINNAVISHLDLQQLVKTISGKLRDIMPHDAAGIALYDPELNQLLEYTNVSYRDVNAFRVGDPIAIEGTPAGEVFLTSKPMLIKRPNPQAYPNDRYASQSVEDSPKSACLAPLTSHGRKLGIAGVSSTEEEKFTEADLELFNQISAQIAIAVENVLNFEQANKERRRAEILLQVTNAISTNLDIEDLLHATSSCLRAYFKHDFAGLALFDAEANQLVTHALDLTKPDQYLFKGVGFPIEGTLNGLAFTSRKPVVRNRIDPNETSWPLASQFFAEQGLKSFYWMPLISHGRPLGVLNLGSRHENALSDEDVNLLQHVASQVAIAVENSLSYKEISELKNKLASEKLYLEEEIQTEYNFAEIVGQSATLKRILQQVATVAGTDSAVLIRGETGTGKELIARAIHNLSNRRERTLVKLNCAAIPTGLLESELFGHEKGAFTGAIAQRIGRFELAHKGTLFLDEVGDIPIELQPKLLRVLQEQEFERLGSSRTIKTDVRLIAATNCDLPQMVAEKKFRSDLFYRLNVFPINIPPLRERIDDISLLVGYFTQKHSARMSKRIKTVDKQTIEALCNYPWPGNVRELENFIERAVILTTGSELQAPLGELAIASNGNKREAPEPSHAVTPPAVSLEAVERAHIEEILRQTGGMIGGKGGAAEILGLPASTLRNRMKKLGIK